MSGVKIIITSICLVTSCVGLVLLGFATQPGAQQQKLINRHYVPSRSSKAAKPIWHSGPASTPPETEIIPRFPSAVPPTRSVRTTSGITVASVEHAPKANTGQPVHLLTADPETQHIQDEFSRLRQNEAARRAFYVELLGTVDRVRAGARDENH